MKDQVVLATLIALLPIVASSGELPEQLLLRCDLKQTVSMTFGAKTEFHQDQFSKDFQDRLVQTEKLASLGQLTAGIAHEIKNPLNFVNNFSALSSELVGEMSDVLAQATVDQKTRDE